MARIAGRELLYVTTDHIGTPRELISEDGQTVAWRADPGLWGKVANDDRFPCPIRFQGQWEDEESGLHYNRFRYYDPEATQYLSPDPIGLKGGFRPNGYTEDPNTFVDPLGLSGCPGWDANVGRYRDAQGRFTSRPVDASGRPLDSPNYSVAYEAQLKPGQDFPGVSDQRHFQESNRQLHQAMQGDPQFAQSMEQLYPGITQGVSPGARGAYPRGAPHQDVTWHHHPTRPGAMQLVPRAQHSAPGPVQGSLHPGGKGGMENWGGGR